jgi:hypothetical protein
VEGDDIEQILAATEDAAARNMKGKARQVLVLVQEVRRSKQRSQQLKDDIVAAASDVNWRQVLRPRSRRKRPHEEIAELQKIREAFERARDLLDGYSGIVDILAVGIDRRAGPPRSAWSDYCARAAYRGIDEHLLRISYDTSPRYPPSEGSWSSIAEARKGLDLLVDELRQEELRRVQQQHQTKDEHGAREKDFYRFWFALALAEVFTRHFGSPPSISRSHFWCAFLATTLARCDRSREAVNTGGAYKLWRSALAWRRTRLAEDLGPIHLRKKK